MYKKINYLILFFVLFLLSFVFVYNIEIIRASDGKEIYVGGIGPGNYTSIQDAINDSNQGDSIFVYSGNYSENIIINKSISIIGIENNNVTIYGNDGLYSLLIKSSNVTISGFTIEKGNVGILISGSDCKFCNITNNVITTNYEAIRMTNTSDNYISNNLFLNIINTGVVLYESSSNVIFNNTFTELNKAIFLGRWSNNNLLSENNITVYTHGIYLDYSFKNQVLNNLINNGDFGVYLTSSKNNTISNNLIGYNNQIGIYTVSSDENFITENIFVENNKDIGKKASPPGIKTPGFEFLLVFIAILFITFVKKYK
jgi:parallel beta-helix repeat protein